MVTFLYAILFFPMTYTSVISNQWIATLFLLIGVRMALENGKQHRYLQTIAVGACIGIAQLLRPDAIVTVLAVVAYGIYCILENKGKWKEYGTQMVVFLLTYCILTNGVMTLLNHTNLITDPQGDDYLWKFVCGLNSQSQGRWSIEDYNKVYDDSLSREERKALELEMIQERLQTTNFLSLWHQKIQIYWNQPDYVWAFGYTDHIEIVGKQVPTEKLLALAQTIEKAIWRTMLVFAIIGIMQKRKKAMFLYAILIGTFLVYLWIEVQGRYSYYTAMLLCIVAAMGIDTMVHCIHHRKKERTHAKSKCDSTHI